jgi:hypothetical protein
VLNLAGFDEEGLEDATGEAGAAHEGLDGEGALRDVGGVLEQANVAGHKRGGEEAEDLPEGEVPGHNGEDDANGVVANVRLGMLGGDSFGGEEADSVVGVIAADGGAFGDFFAGGGEGLAHLGGHDDGELFAIGFKERGEAAHPEDALVDGLLGVGLGGARRDS